MAGVWYYAEVGVCRGAGVVRSEMQSCFSIYSLEYVIFRAADATFEYFMCALNGCTAYLYMPPQTLIISIDYAGFLFHRLRKATCILGVDQTDDE